MNDRPTPHMPVTCRCLGVDRSEVVDCIAVTGAETVREVTAHTGAGSGCTACHRRICDLLNGRTAVRPFAAPAG